MTPEQIREIYKAATEAFERFGRAAIELKQAMKDYDYAAYWDEVSAADEEE